MLTEQRRVARAKLANATARAARDPQAAAEVEDLRREYRYLSAEDYIKRVVDEAPPLSPYQRDALALLLHGTAAPPGRRRPPSTARRDNWRRNRGSDPRGAG